MPLSRGGQRLRKFGAQAFSIGGRLLCVAALTVAAGCTSDGSASSSSAATSAGLQISGSPAQQALIGQAYAFTPVVKDASAPAAVGFSIQNKPGWATFNTASGELHGTPTSADVGNYPGIVISASTSGAQASLAGFTITVPQAGAVVVSWQAPATNTDGSPVADVSGYTIHYGTIASLLTQSVTVDNPNTSYTFQNLTSGVWYFALSANSSAGVQGAVSDPVSMTVD